MNQNALKNSKSLYPLLPWIKRGIFSFLLGSIILAVIATLQRTLFKIPIEPKWYLIPITVGGTAGLLTGLLLKRIQIYAQKLKFSELRFQDLFEKAPIAYQSMDPNGVIVDVNHTWLDSFEYTRYDVIGRHFSDFLPSKSIKLLEQHVQNLKNNIDNITTELEIRSNNGNILIIELESRPSTNNLGELDQIHSVIRDITETKKQETALRESEKLYRSLIENASDAILIMQGNQFIDCNQKTLELFDCTRDQILDAHPWDLSPDNQPNGDKSKEKSIENVTKALAGVPQYFEWLHVTFGGKAFFAEVSLNSITISDKKLLLAIVRDVSERKRITASLETINKTLLNSSSDFKANINNLTELCGNILGAACCIYSRINKDQLEIIGSWNLPKTIPLKFRLEGSICSQVANSNKDWLFIPEIDPQNYIENTIIHQLSIKSYFGHIIKQGGEKVGILCVFHNKPYEPNDYDKNMLGIISSGLNVEESRHFAQQHMRESEEKFRAIFNGVSDAVFIHDIDTAEILTVNDTMCKMYGFEQDEIKNITLKDISSGVPPYTLEEAGILLKKALSEEVSVFEWQAKHKSGKIFWIEVNMKKVHIAGIDRIVVVARDITERKISEKALLESENKYRSLLNQLPVGIYRRQFQEDGRMILANPAVYKMFGYDTFEEFARNPLPNFYLDPSKFKEFNKLLIEQGKVDNFDLPLKKKDGTPLYCKIWATLVKGPTINYVDGILVDISAQKKALEENTRLARAIEQASEVVIITDIEGTMQYVNPAFEKTSGFSRKEAIGQNPRILKSGEHEPEYYEALWNTILSGKIWKSQVINKKKDGTLYTEEVEISPIRDEDGNITNFVSVNHDITRELELEGQIRQSQKMEAIGQLAGGVAHDFNNMLQVIAGYTELTQDILGEGNPARKTLDHVAKASERATALVRQLLAFSRRETLQLKQIDLNDLTSGLLKMIRRIIGEHIELSFHPGADLQILQADPGQVEQILLNLCVNARDAMPEGGKLSIETENMQLSKEYCQIHAEAQEGNYVAINVSDTGKGIPKDIRDRIFEPFFTTKAVGEGTGLGLSTVYAITKRHGGFINLYSEEGMGTVFKIYLPANKDQNSTIEAEKQRQYKELKGAGETILLAEDDEQVRELAELILEQAGYNIITAVDGENAIEKFSKYNKDLDLVILDVVMPKKSGRMVHDHIRKTHPDLPIVFASGYSHDMLDTGHLPEEGYRLVRKPFDQSGLLIAIQEAMSKEK